MEQYHAEMLAVSLAGHDKGKCYVVLGQENGFFLLSDGKYKPLERPKKKKPGWAKAKSQRGKKRP